MSFNEPSKLDSVLENQILKISYDGCYTSYDYVKLKR